MLYLFFCLFILLLVMVITSFINRFSIVRIIGESMSPTFKNGKILFVDRFVSPKYQLSFGEKVREGEVFVYCNPDGKIVIKRMIQKIQVSEFDYYYWFEGDNVNNSIDSRDYGYIQDDAILGQVISFSTFLKRTFSNKREIAGGENGYV